MKTFPIHYLMISLIFPLLLTAKAPDLTQGQGVPAKGVKDWNLGPTGARGWIYSDKYSTSEARQIYVTAVEKSSPAYKKLFVGDVVLGVGREKFNDDPRRVFGRAIANAEAKKGGLELLVWRQGKNLSVNLKLQSIGKYSSTAPFNCSKSDMILKQACEFIAQDLKKNKRRSNWIVRSSNALALLASGDPSYLVPDRNEPKSFKYNNL
ncbi:hypothetical protein LNTAR_07579 [Lentisphaera araneosa HTCC2155]|uniref:PDZ domain-containing protein n=1 Tax=Lentisphaera araneosa HTCC2155 TaxID=313628 RepID=A6DQZ7_9BACT|nr:DUF6288 domain-containing protein [Lentisphaera araneosa]EDM25885.1 hypothetical protein LNTAR_07579 [Lentisphaera araneosa HTCC2155]